CFVTDHKRQDARNVTLKRQAHQVVGYRHVVVESFGNSDRCRRVHNGIGSGFHSLQRQLDIANVMEVLVQNGVIRGSELAPELCGLGRNRIERKGVSSATLSAMY